MDPFLDVRIREILEEALDLSPELRGEYLTRACADDGALLIEVKRCLAVHDANPDWLADPSGRQAPVPPDPGDGDDPLMGSSVGPYQLTQRLGVGGFGMVYEAEQTEPVRRRVALKVIKPGMDSRDSIARFRGEQQALAMMNHPGIAKVFDAGTTPEGRLYFVMELVEGRRITSLCDAERLDVRRRLELFLQVCDAVQHAHQKGIIHRDLTPSNILAATADSGPPAIKVIDFGIAKALQRPLSVDTYSAGPGVTIGKPEYMSPEQAEGLPDIDTRTDVYSLGALLYQLMTGVTPFDGAKLRSAPFADFQRTLMHTEPPQPSRRAADHEKERCRNQALTPPPVPADSLRGDLDWITMKCLEKDRTRRYRSVDALAADIRRHLEGKPVEAAPPSRMYTVRKFIRRHRLGLAAATLAAVVLIVGAAGAASSSVYYQMAGRERQRARDVADFVRPCFELVRPVAARGRDTALLREMIDGAATRLEAGHLSSFPEADVIFRVDLARTYQELGLQDRATDLIRPAIAQAQRLYDRGADDAALYLYKAHGVHAIILGHQSRWAEAEVAYSEALAKAREAAQGDLDDIASSLEGLSQAMAKQGKYASAEPLLVEAGQMWRRMHGDNAIGLLKTTNDLARLRFMTGDYSAAAEAYEDVLARAEAVFGIEHPNVARCRMNLAMTYHAMNRSSEAEPLTRLSLKASRKYFGETSVEAAADMDNVAKIVFATRPEEALSLWRKCLDMVNQMQPGDHELTARIMCGLGYGLLEAGDLEAAEAMLEESRGMYERLGAIEPTVVAATIQNLAECALLRDQTDRALSLAREAAAMQSRALPPDHPDVAKARALLQRIERSKGK